MGTLAFYGRLSPVLYSDLVGLAFEAVIAAFADIGRRIILAGIVTVVAFLLSLPILGALSVLAGRAHSIAVLTFGIVVVMAMLPNPAQAGVQYTFREQARKEPLVGVGDQWTGLRQFGPFALRVWLVSVFVTIVIMSNLVFYNQHRLSISVPMEAFWATVLFIWLAVHLFVYPLILEQERQRVLLVYRNAALLALSRPLVVLVVLPIWVLVLVIGTGTGLIGIVGLSLGASIQQHATMRVMATFPRKG